MKSEKPSESSSSSTEFQPLFDSLTSHGWLSKAEARALWECMFGVILEVGSYYGRSTRLLAHKGPVIAVDPFENFDTGDMSGEKAYAGFLESTKDTPYKVTLHKMKIEDWKPELVDTCFLDGDHTYEGTKRQIEVALQCDPWIISVHDFKNSTEGIRVIQACEELLGRPDEVVDTLAIWNRKELESTPPSVKKT